jgi:hypothetical protein
MVLCISVDRQARIDAAFVPIRRRDHPDQFRDREALHYHGLRRQRHEALAPADRSDRNYAKHEGCKRVRIYGRKGWLHVLDGFEEKHIIMDKELD